MSSFDLIRQIKESKARKSKIKLPDFKYDKYEIETDEGDYIALVPPELCESFEDALSIYESISPYQLRTLLKECNGIIRKIKGK